ncbi:MAG: LacI family DNA-binding transcriptional regulator [Actinomycetes bacterium]
MVVKKVAQPANVVATIDLVAQTAGVSRATVSRVMNGTAKVSPDTEKAVRKAIKKHNFTPNMTARRLAGGRSGLVALVLEESSEEFFLNPFWGFVVQGFTSAITDAGMQPVLLIRPKTGSEDSLFASLRIAQVDGLAIFSWHRSVKSFEKLIPPTMAVVFGGDLGGTDKYPYVDVDNVEGGYLATKHLIKQGCKNIITITGDLKLQSGRDRFNGFEHAMSEAGMKIPDSHILHGDYSMAMGEELTRSLLAKKIQFDGLFAGNDLTAVGAINVLLQNGIRVPEDVKVVGFDDSPLASRNLPSLSSIFQPTRELGAEVARSLVSILEGKKVDRKTLSVKLIVRDSSKK